MSKDYFIYVGNAYPHKNLEWLIKAVVMAKTKLKIVSARNIFIDRLKKFIEKENAQKYVELVGYISDDKLKKLYKNSIAFIFPTLVEGFGLPPMEAINSGTLAIVSDIPVLKEVYQKSVFYFDPYDDKSISDSMNNVSKIPMKERKKIIKSSQIFLKRYSWKKMARETLEVYNSLDEYK